MSDKETPPQSHRWRISDTELTDKTLISVDKETGPAMKGSIKHLDAQPLNPSILDGH